jgi:hypothetical protein
VLVAESNTVRVRNPCQATTYHLGHKKSLRVLSARPEWSTSEGSDRCAKKPVWFEKVYRLVWTLVTGREAMLNLVQRMFVRGLRQYCGRTCDTVAPVPGDVGRCARGILAQRDKGAPRMAARWSPPEAPKLLWP